MASQTMTGAYLPGNRQVQLRKVPRPAPGFGEVLVKMRASTICGSDLRAIYREHLGKGPEAYQGVIGGHEPAGEIVEVGPGCKRFGVGDRVILYHIAGCGICDECRKGYMIGCTSRHRAAYGWQRDGGHADYLVAAEYTCVPLPDELSYLDGACVACGFGTAYEALCRAAVSGRDRVLITGLGPVGLAAGLLARALGSRQVIGFEVTEQRRRLALEIGAVDHAFEPAEGPERLAELTGGEGCEVSVDCSGAAPARLAALKGTRRWGRCVFVGEGGTVDFDVSPVLIHPQITLIGSWVTSVGRMEELARLLVLWNLHPEVTVTDRFRLDDAAQAYRVADQATGGKVGIVMED
ncbi:MAG TPA: zinc-binding dehydrogenase [Actinomycetota bacterium]|nr:zinc-binding dehydrogenase [Actinomycetota bacterium]